MSIFTPTNQKRLTNVSVVRLKKAGKRFEVACYPNKVIPWRERIETDLDEVLQTPHVYANVSKGEFAKRQDVEKAFGTTCAASGGGIDERLVCELILRQGELQLTDRERAAALAQLTREVATLIAARCINPLTGRPYSVSMVEKAMRELRPAAVQLRQDRGAKQHMLHVIRRLNESAEESNGKSGLVLIRTQMRVCVRPGSSVSSKELANIRAAIVEHLCPLENETDREWTGLCDPGALRELQRIVHEGEPAPKGGQVDIIDLRVDPVEECAQKDEQIDEAADQLDKLSEEEDLEELETGVASASLKEKCVEKSALSCSGKAATVAKVAAGASAEDRKAERRRQRKEKRADQHQQLMMPQSTDEQRETSNCASAASRGKRKNKKGKSHRGMDSSDED